MPWGHCLEVVEKASKKYFSQLRVAIKNGTFEIFITDKNLNLHYRLDESTLLGDRITIEGTPEQPFQALKYYQIKIEENYLTNMKDELCDNYPTEKYTLLADCVLDKEKNILMPKLGCMPPWMSPDRQCTGVVHDKSGTVNKFLMAHWHRTKSLRNNHQGQ